MIATPPGITNDRVFDFLIPVYLDFYWNRQPHRTVLVLLSGYDSSSPPGILNIIKQDKFVDLTYQIEMPLHGM